LTDFGLSKVGLINSTDDLSGPAVSGTSLYGEDDTHAFASEQLNRQERRKKRSAVGTPDYLAPEILLGTGHGLYDKIFDNILNRKIPWPQVPGEMSFEAQDLIDK
ncbi:hypothetical protein B296_00051585, partial [Ensete ventricosum]